VVDGEELSVVPQGLAAVSLLNSFARSCRVTLLFQSTSTCAITSVSLLHLFHS